MGFAIEIQGAVLEGSIPYQNPHIRNTFSLSYDQLQTTLCQVFQTLQI